jgi:hypothetical protein
MLEAAFASHLKQHVVIMDHATGHKMPVRCKKHARSAPPVSAQMTQPVAPPPG